MRNIQLKTKDGRDTIQVTCGEIFRDTVGIHYCVGKTPQDAAQFIMQKLFTASHLRTGQAIVMGVDKEIAVAVGAKFLEFLPESLRQTEDVAAIVASLPDGFGAWAREMEFTNQYIPWKVR
ncbi:hypothetical protein LCGC14_1376780, partial [marine sediment metagenome]